MLAWRCVLSLTGHSVKAAQEHSKRSPRGCLGPRFWSCWCFPPAGRIKQLIELDYLSTASVRLLVLDEADKLLEEGSFQEQIK